MPTAVRRPQGAIYAEAAQYADDLAAGQSAAADQLVAAWSQAYGQTRIELDNLAAKIAAARAAGQPVSPAWLYQQGRLKAVLNTAKVELAQYAQYAENITTQAQVSAVRAAQRHAERLTRTAAAEVPGLASGFVQVNEANLRNLAGFLAASPLDELLRSLPGEATDALRGALVRGIALGWGADKMTREATRAMGIARWRAETIMRTEALRAYRETARQTYMANDDVLEGWVWNAHLDSRTCLACAVMDGTVHATGETLDGHPRCRCAMVPRTKSWADLTGQDLPDTRPPIRSGKQWLEGQPAHVQRAMLGPGRYEAWKSGQITLDDMVARPANSRWGTMRRERSMAEIRQGRNPNDLPGVQATGAPAPQAQGPFSPDQLRSALDPSRKRTPSAVRAELERTPEGRDLAAAIKGFTETRGGVANLRRSIEDTLDGTAGAAAKAKAQAVIDAMNAYPTEDIPTLFRGFAVKVERDTNEWWDAFEAQFQPGQRINLNASSFTSSERKAAEFQAMIGGTRKAGRNYTAVRYVLEGETRALPVEQLSKFKSEKEWLTGGQFEVVGYQAATKAQPYYRVTIRQVKTLGTP